MHELGIVMNVVEQVDKIAADNGAQKVIGITMEIGEVICHWADKKKIAYKVRR